MSWFVDTNVFIRYLTQDDPAKADAVEALFDRAEHGAIELLTSEAVVAEITYVLGSPAYRMERSDIAASVTALLDNPGIQCLEGNRILAALELYAETRLDFPDCVAAAHTLGRRLDGIYSYDRGFDEVDDLVRREPVGSDTR
jgi:uncharacterized protein